MTSSFFLIDNKVFVPLKTSDGNFDYQSDNFNKNSCSKQEFENKHSNMNVILILYFM